MHRSTQLAAVLLLGWLPGCVDLGSMMTMDATPSFDCARLSTEQTWWIGPSGWTTTPDPLPLAVGGTQLLYVEPSQASLHCPGTITSVTWSLQDSGVAKIDPRPPEYDDTWITGLNPGTTTVTVDLVFADGRTRQASRTVVVSVSSPPAGSGIVLEGTVELDACAGITVCDYRRWVPFSLPNGARQLDATLDWTSIWNEGDLVLHTGTCEGGTITPCPGLGLVPTTDVWRVKPLPLSTTNLPAGPYTLRVDNVGRGRDTFHYEVRVIPP
jgi:hypothetical protein